MPIKTEKDYKDFTSYVVSKRSIEKEAQGKKTGIDQAAAGVGYLDCDGNDGATGAKPCSSSAEKTSAPGAGV